MKTQVASELKVRSIPLSMLVPNPENIRRYVSEDGLKELAQSILTQGLLQNLNVRKNAQGRYETKAGNRRLRALRDLVKRGLIAKDYVAPCQVLSSQNDVEVALAENMQREAMHPADEIEAYRVLNDKGRGMTPEMIGDRFGKSHMTVRRRLKLAKVSPKIMQLFREDKATLEQLEALAITDDQAKQEEAFFEAKQDWERSAHQLRARLTSDLVKASDPLAKFVGLSAYRKAGGEMICDLFDGDKGGNYSSRALLMNLAMMKLEDALKSFEAQGWKYLAPMLNFSSWEHMVLRPLPQPLQPVQAKRRAVLLVRLDLLEEGEGDLTPKQELQRDKIIDQVETIDGAAKAFTPEQKALSGVVAYVSHDGKLAVEFGVVQDCDKKAAGQIGKEVASDDVKASEQISIDTELLSNAVLEDLTKHQTVALSAHIASQHDFAFRLMVFTLARQNYCSGNSQGAVDMAVKFSSVTQSQQDPDNVLAYEEAHKRRQAIEAFVPKDEDRLWMWAMTASDARLKEVLAQVVSNGLNVVRQNGQSLSQTRRNDLARIVKQTQFNFRAWWQPSTSFFKRVSKSIAVKAVTECKLPQELAAGIEKAKKPEAVKASVEALKATDWVPACMRPVELVASSTLSVEDEDECPFDVDVEDEQLAAVDA